MSIAGPEDPLLSALMQAAMKRGVTFVGAASEQANGFPTGVPGVIAAQGLERSFRPDAFSVPADKVLTLRPDGQYDFESGTSVAAAELTGVIALLQSSSESRLSTGTIVSLLKETAGSSGAVAGSAPNSAGGAASTAANATGSAINVNAALAKLDVEQHSGRVAARDTRH